MTRSTDEKRGKNMKKIALAFALLTMSCGFLVARALADDTPKTPEQIAAQQEIDKINADRALLEAQTAKFKAEQDADKARKQVEIDRITAEKALLEAQNAKSAAQDDNDK